MDRQAEYERLGLAPPPDDGTRLSAQTAWDETTRQHREATETGVEYSRRRRLVGRHLIDVHDRLRRELGEVRDGARGAGAPGRGAPARGAPPCAPISPRRSTRSSSRSSGLATTPVRSA